MRSTQIHFYGPSQGGHLRLGWFCDKCDSPAVQRVSCMGRPDHKETGGVAQEDEKKVGGKRPRLRHAEDNHHPVNRTPPQACHPLARPLLARVHRDACRA